MQRLLLAAASGLALFAASVSLAAAGGAPRAHLVLWDAAARTAAHSVRFELRVQIASKGDGEPYTLEARGASGGRVEHVHVKVGDVTAPDGSQLTGPSADEKSDGTFLYFRSTLTRGSFGALWVRERLAAVSDKAPELALLHQVSPAAILRAVADVRDARAGVTPLVFHSVLPFAAPDVQAALDGLEGPAEFRALRLTAWSNADGLLRLVVISGRTSDRSSTFLLTLALHGYDEPVLVTPPREDGFVDFDLQRLAT